MTTCPTCGSTRLDGPDCGCDCDQEARIAAWLEADSIPRNDSGKGPELACTACGYSGDMTVDASVTSCPVCGAVASVRRFDVVLRVALQIECPGCGRKVGVTAEDEGKTVLCPGCSYFLGTPLEKPRSRRHR